MVKMRSKDKCYAQWIMKENCLSKVYRLQIRKKKRKQKKIEEKKLFCVTAKCGIVLTKGRVQVVIVYNGIHIT